MKSFSVILTVILTAIMLISCPGFGEDPPKDDPAPLTYTVTYYGNGSDGGTVPTDSNNYEENTDVTVIAAGTMTQAGYIFTGWNTAENGSETARAAGSTFTMGASDITFTCITSTGNYDDNSGVIVYNDSLIITEANWLLADSSIIKCRIEDNHGGVAAFFIIGEIRIIHSI